ncbi:MAG: MlaA family lipoprotein [Candidatus Berkiella sp.]
MRRLLSCALLSAMLWGCQKTNPHPMDPFEGINREIYGLNKTLDKALIKPVAYVYWQYLPTPFQAGIGNFYDNLREIPNVANDILQGKFGYASHDASRFVINSTLGIGGFFDVAGRLGLPHRREDFGQTLYVWGWHDSAYLVLPLLGPSTIRDTVGLTVDYYAFSVWTWIHDDEWRYGLLALDLIDLRARLLRHDTVLSTVAVDEYAFMRDAYFQRRLYLVNNELDNDINLDGQNDIDPYAAPLGDEDKSTKDSTVQKDEAAKTDKPSQESTQAKENKSTQESTQAKAAQSTGKDQSKLADKAIQQSAGTKVSTTSPTPKNEAVKTTLVPVKSSDSKSTKTSSDSAASKTAQ